MGTLVRIFQIPELRKRILFTLALLAVYRIGVFVTVPGVDRNAMSTIMAGQQNNFLGLFNMFSGGAIEQLSVVGSSRVDLQACKLEYSIVSPK